jgi:hypothetical protein
LSKRRSDQQLREEAEKRAGEFIARFGETITDQKRHECRRAGQLAAIADLMRDQALGGTVDFDKLQQAEDMAAAAVLALGLPEHPTVTKLEVVLVDGNDVCIKCRAPLPPRSERVPVEAAGAPQQQEAAAANDVRQGPPVAPTAPSGEPSRNRAADLPANVTSLSDEARARLIAERRRAQSAGGVARRIPRAP